MRREVGRKRGLTPSVVLDFIKQNRKKSVWVFGTLIIISLVGWKLYERRYPSWDEEVQLSDGRVITIHQKHEYFSDYGTNQSWVTIDLPELGGKRIWHSYLRPMHIDVQGSQVYVFGSPRGPRQVQFYRYPKNHLVAFKWNDAGFERIPFLDVPESFRKEENVLPCLPPDKQYLVTLKQKSIHWCTPTGDKDQFTKKINLPAYQELAVSFARLDGGRPLSD